MFEILVEENMRSLTVFMVENIESIEQSSSM